MLLDFVILQSPVLKGIISVSSTFSDHGKSSILSHTLSWITVIAHLTFVFTSRARVLCLCGESDSVFFPVDGGRKKEESKMRAALWRVNVPANGFVREVLRSEVRQFGLLYHTIPGIPWRVTSPSERPAIRGFMFHHYLLMFGLFWLQLSGSFLFSNSPVQCSVLIHTKDLSSYESLFQLEILRNFLMGKLAERRSVYW